MVIIIDTHQLHSGAVLGVVQKVDVVLEIKLPDLERRTEILGREFPKLSEKVTEVKPNTYD